MALEEYKRKRNFKATPEPEGKVESTQGKNSFVIQKHAASRLHYDFRLELAGVLLSWAVPKGPSLDPDEKRLAVHVEDHPLDYGTFEGIIPKGQYGGGTVLLWDRGTWEPEGDPAAGYKKGHLKFHLHGEKLKGGWNLVRIGGRKGDDNDNWLLIKEKDDEARPGSGDAVVEERPESVSTGRSMDEIAADSDNVWQSNHAEKAEKTATPSAFDPSSLPGARKARRPSAVEAQLATLVDETPSGDEWIHEIKLDGYRVLCFVEDGETRIVTRNGKNWTDRFAPVARAAGKLPVRAAILDGEVVVVEPDGRTSFQALQNALTENRDRDLVFFAFDLLYLDGYDLRKAPLLARKEALAAVVAGSQGTIRYSDHVEGDGEGFYRQACSFALEGIIAKRGDLPYHPGRNKDWVKVKCLKRQEFVIAAEAKRPAANKVKTAAATKPGPKPPVHPASEEVDLPSSGRSQKKEVEVSGVRISNPERVLYPEQGVTKKDLAVYYSRISDWILPHLIDRPLTLVRCPEGRAKQCFYQKHIGEHVPASIRRIDVGDDEPYGTLSSLEGLVSLVQMGVLELHIWGSHRDKIEQPDYVVFDLDPDEGLGWDRVVEGALKVREFLTGLGLRTFLKTTGGKGLHVVLPLTRKLDWDQVKAFTKGVADTIAAAEPDRYTSKLPKASRKGKVFIDYLRNGRGATSIAAYSTRARPGAPVSAPLFWEELETGVRANTYTVQNLPERLESLPADPWEGFSKVRQSITAATLKAVGIK